MSPLIYENGCPEMGALSVELCQNLINAKVFPLSLIYENEYSEIGVLKVEAGAIMGNQGKQVQVGASMGQIRQVGASRGK